MMMLRNVTKTHGLWMIHLTFSKPKRYMSKNFNRSDCDWY